MQPPGLNIHRIPHGEYALMHAAMGAAIGRCASASRRLRWAMAGEAIGATQGVGQPVLACHVPD
jgi:hypothetical protein